MPNRRQRGRRTQHLVAELWRMAGWDHAESTPASVPGPDVDGLPGIDVECKARAGFDPAGALKQAEKRSPDALHVAVLRLNGQGEDARDYVACVRLGTLVDLLATHPDHRPDADDLAASIARHPSNITLGTGMVIYR